MRFYNDITGEIIDYPEEAAALFAALKPVPSERAKSDEVSVDDGEQTKTTGAKASTKEGK